MKEASKETKEQVKERYSEATSKETLSDLSESEKVPSSKPSQSDRVSVPSPDGAEDDKRGQLGDEGVRS